MADSTISGLQPVTEIYGSDLFVLEQGGVAKKLTGDLLSSFIDRSFISASVTELDSTATPTVSYDYVTGRMVFGIPRGLGIKQIYKDENELIHYVFDDNQEVVLESVKGETGKSAYMYAVENGYEGSEPDYEQLMLDLFNASLNEAERVAAEQQRTRDYQYILENTQEQLDKFEKLMDYADSKVVHTTLILYRGGVRLFDTTLML